MPNQPDLPAFYDLVDLLHERRTVVLSGAGCSTESGIPDYRGPKTRHLARKPIQYSAFVMDPGARARYWARSAVGWPRLAVAQPNEGHQALTHLEKAGYVTSIITQNVDRLHQRAGSRRVLELHGSLAEVHCLDCGARETRAAFQERLHERNPGWSARAGELAPDGDVELAPDVVRAFQVPGCLDCGGVLKPDVVFFGENVPRERVEAAWRLVDEADVLLVVGSSLAVYSGYRFVRGAAQRCMPVAIVNLGATRGDGQARLCVSGRLGEVLPRLAAALQTRARVSA